MSDNEIKQRIMEVLQRKVASPTLEIAALAGLSISEVKRGLSVLEKEGKIVIKDRATTDDLTREIVVLHHASPEIRTGDFPIVAIPIVLVLVYWLLFSRR